MEKKIEITITQESTKVDLEHTSNSEVALALCNGVFHVCKGLNIPIGLITGTLNDVDSFLSKSYEKDKSENKSDLDKISDFIDDLKGKNFPLEELATLAAILAIHNTKNH